MEACPEASTTTTSGPLHFHVIDFTLHNEKKKTKKYNLGRGANVLHSKYRKGCLPSFHLNVLKKIGPNTLNIA